MKGMRGAGAGPRHGRKRDVGSRQGDKPPLCDGITGYVIVGT